SFGEEMDKNTDLHQHLSRLCSQRLETASQDTRDAVTTHLTTVSQEIKMASARMTQPKIKNILFHDGALENQLLSVLLLICLEKHDCVERIPSEYIYQRMVEQDNLLKAQEDKIKSHDLMIQQMKEDLQAMRVGRIPRPMKGPVYVGEHYGLRLPIVWSKNVYNAKQVIL
nr:hypothetical protein [Tanacetum cinerariifolium]